MIIFVFKLVYDFAGKMKILDVLIFFFKIPMLRPIFFVVDGALIGNDDGKRGTT